MSLPLVTLKRIYLEDRTIGSLSTGHKTLERAWKQNKTNESCFPPGLYKVLPDDTGRHQWFKVHDVTERTGIELHGGSIPTNSDGCLMVGLAHNKELNLTGGDIALVILKKDYPDGFLLLVRQYDPIVGDVW